MNGYEKELKESVSSTDTVCTTCGGPGTLTTLRLKDVNDEVICVFNCGSCNEKTVNFFDKMYDERGSIRIECDFNDQKDLHREVNLNQSASVEITSDGLSYKYETGVPGVYNVESLLRQAEDEMKNLCGKGDAISKAGGKTLGVTASHEECNKKLENIQSLILKPRFRMVIEDEYGLSRVAPIGKGVFELQHSDIADFDDNQVKHIFKRK